jgi:hypothetical protein
MRLGRHIFGLIAVLPSSAWAGDGMAFFESKIRPLLAEHCYECHSVRAKKLKGGLLLDSRAGVMKGGDSGAILVPGKPEESRMIKALSYRDADLQMPPKGKLDDSLIGLLREWIAIGAPDPRVEPVGEIVVEPGIDYEAGRKFWSFVPPVDHELPAVRGESWPRRDIDRFTLAKMESAGLAPAVEAARRTLVRRAYLDLHGLPPTTEQLQAFLGDDRRDAWEQLIDKILASPRYGERWGRHWLDVARYSDSNGMDEDIAHPNAWRYRDYVIASFNEDLRFDQFIVEQLAGDLLASENVEEKQARTVGLGFLSVGPKMLACDDPDKMRRDIVDEQIDTMGRAFMGMTLGCARCHDHKFDPVSTADYYGLAGIFLSTKTLTKYTVVAQYHEYELSDEATLKSWRELKELEAKRDDKKTAKEDKESLKKEVEELRKKLPPRHRVMGVTEDATVDAKVHLRGNYLTLGELVPRRVLPVIAGLNQALMPEKQSGRLELARWIASADHPLTARVIVNRLWRWHFGRGLVATPDNFGELGARPSHPKLLDYLARKLVSSEWSLKSVHRELMNSATYRQGALSEGAREKDPENKLFARWKPRRVEAEVLRDSILFKSNRLDLTVGGGMIVRGSTEYIDKGKMGEWSRSSRRAVYLPVIRSAGYDGLNAFDFSDPSVSDGDRKTSTVTPQALFLMNSPLVHEASHKLSEILLGATDGASDQDRARWMILHLYGRSAHAGEAAQIESFVSSYAAQAGKRTQNKAWAALVRAFFASNEFLYIE